MGKVLNSMPANAEVVTGKSVTCAICQKKFSRTDHLKRHQLRHSGIKPYSCIFCNESFTRSDNLRDHYPGCSQRRNRLIPEAARGGRRSHACDTCTLMKLGCDGNSPCKTCRQKGIDCKFSRLQSKGVPTKKEASNSNPDKDPSSDRGSIKFLLNSGTASFLECFRFPSENERRNLFNFRNTRTGSTDSNIHDFFGNSSENGSTFSDPFEDEPFDWSLFEDENLLRFLSSPFSDVQMQSEEMFAPLFMESNYAGNGPMNLLTFPGEWEPTSVQSSAVVQLILEKAISLQTSPQEQADIQQHLNFLFTPSKITRLVNLYFEFWHPHCPIVHQPTFSIDTAPIPLLIAVTLMGAMYSQADGEVHTAKVLLDLAESVIYSVDDLTDEFEIKQMLRASTAQSEKLLFSSPTAFSHLQAAYLMVVVQFWAGNMASRKRTIETRFGIVVKVARRLGLTKARHGLEDSVDESSWIQKEAGIRLINIMTLLDCAFSFFANFPCRLTLSEMKFDLPCEEGFFSSCHPFSERSFTFSRHITVNEAFRSLFPPKNTPPLSNQSKKSNALGLNPLDMFILIHILYVYTLTHITLFSSSFPHSTHQPSPNIFGTSTPGGSFTSSSPTDSNDTLIKAALSRWRCLWTAIRSNMPDHAWASLGFFRNGYNYWLVTQLLINNKGSGDLMMGMEVGCEDTLKQLKGLLRE